MFSGHLSGCPSVRPLTPISRNAIYLYLVDGLLMKLAANIHNVTGNCRKGCIQKYLNDINGGIYFDVMVAETHLLDLSSFLSDHHHHHHADIYNAPITTKQEHMCSTKIQIVVDETY